MIDFGRMLRDLLAVAVLAVVAFAAVSVATYDPFDPPSTAVYPPTGTTTNACGPAGARVAYGLITTFGVGAYAFLGYAAALDLRLFSRRPAGLTWTAAGGRAAFVVALCGLASLVARDVGGLSTFGSGGRLGLSLALGLGGQLSFVGTLIALTSVAVSGLVIAGDAAPLVHAARGAAATLGRLLRPIGELPLRLLRACGRACLALVPRRYTVAAADTENDHADDEAAVEDEYDEADDDAPVAIDPDDLPERLRSLRVNRPAAMAAPPPRPPAEDPELLDLPGLDLLSDAEDFPFEELAEKARVAAETLERTFQEFGLNITVAEVDTGPVVTQFELALEKGLRVNKVTKLADDLAIALRVPAVRIVSPIPGKNTVGVEVPNETRVTVKLKELIESMPPASEKHAIPMYLGKDVSGHAMVADLAKMPHLLIAGRTGTGKSVCLNTLILSILMTRRPDEVKMLMIDPKMVELSPFKSVPHLMHPVITDMKKAEATLAWAVEKMEERYALLARCGVRHLNDYNKLDRQTRLDRMGIGELHDEAASVPDKMPYIVIVADEMADLMMTSGKDVEAHIIRLAQKSRAVGIHLVLATQKPTVDVITGLIKSNLPARISFQVASRTDSRVVLDEMGAERLLGAGDMLYLMPGTSKIVRAQGTFVSGDEVDNVIGFFDDVEPQYSEELARVTESSAGSGEGGNVDEEWGALKKKDDMYEAAVDVVVGEGRGSTSLLQRALGIGYGRAARLIDFMAEDGIVGEYNGSQAREVLYSPEQWAAIKHGEMVEA